MAATRKDDANRARKKEEGWGICRIVTTPARNYEGTWGREKTLRVAKKEGKRGGNVTAWVRAWTQAIGI